MTYWNTNYFSYFCRIQMLPIEEKELLLEDVEHYNLDVFILFADQIISTGYLSWDRGKQLKQRVHTSGSVSLMDMHHAVEAVCDDNYRKRIRIQFLLKLFGKIFKPHVAGICGYTDVLRQ